MTVGNPAFSRREPCDPAPDPRRLPGMERPEVALRRAHAAFAAELLSRRRFLAASAVGALGLAACAPRRVDTMLPAADWREPPPVRVPPQVALSAPEAAAPASAEPVEASPARTAAAGFAPDAALPWAKPRFLWARGAPERALLNPMLPVTCVTIHHDGLEDLIWTARPDAVAERLERYRAGHRARGWADIGYHLIIDRGGVLWQGRSIRWQGAHVQHHNEGNIGVLVMGNFDLQSPTAAQLTTLRRVLVDLRATYGFPRGRVYTHKEWEDAQTACPGRRLQPRVERVRQAIGA